MPNTVNDKGMTPPIYNQKETVSKVKPGRTLFYKKNNTVAIAKTPQLPVDDLLIDNIVDAHQMS